MELSTLLKGVKVKDIRGGEVHAPLLKLDIKGLAFDSRRVRAGDLFFALHGGRKDGNAFIKDALDKGAVAVLSEQAMPAAQEAPASTAAFIEVEDGRAALARAAANFHEDPSGKIAVTGITGTNGKTTTALLIQGALERLGSGAGLIGTIKYIVGGSERPAPHTTPEAPDFQSMLARMHRAGQTHAVAEVSSHALAQKRVDGTSFRVAVFTNLTRDHLDFHKTMEDYFEAKKRLFVFGGLLEEGGCAVINADDPFGGRLLEAVGSSLPGRGTVLACGTGREAPAGGGAGNIRYIRAERQNIRNLASGLRFDILYQGSRYPVSSPLIGAHNVYNLLAAFGALAGLGFSPQDAIRGLESLEGVNGRFEKVERGQDFLAVIDYAHTPDALERLIQAARAISKGRVITVFGCGGDRDKGKRGQMGSIAATLSDQVVITSDNPRSEDPAAIIADIKEGIPAGGAHRCTVIADRAEAIEAAMAMARPGDAVLIAGKGHEDYQEINGVRSPFSDRLAAIRALEKKGKK